MFKHSCERRFYCTYLLTANFGWCRSWFLEHSQFSAPRTLLLSLLYCPQQTVQHMFLCVQQVWVSELRFVLNLIPTADNLS
jgi:hypothetical protein